MRILTVAFPFAPVRPDTAGGAEQIAGMIDRGLVERGHHSCVLASASSQVVGKLFALPDPQGDIDQPLRDRMHAFMRQQIRRIVAEERIELVHLHGLDFPKYAPDHIPALATLHLPLDWYGEGLADLPANIQLVCVSQTQAASATRRLETVPNGVPARFRRDIRRRNFCLVLSRICPEKGIHLAMDAARLAEAGLLIAGDVFPYREHVDYFTHQVSPRLDRLRRFIGRVGPSAKARLLSSARALIIPSCAAETSSLTAMEAIRAGTPVIAFPNGALPEIIQHGCTGFLVTDTRAMADAIHRTQDLDADHCRRVGNARFDATRMVEEYVALYCRLGAGK